MQRHLVHRVIRLLTVIKQAVILLTYYCRPSLLLGVFINVRSIITKCFEMVVYILGHDRT